MKPLTNAALSVLVFFAFCLLFPDKALAAIAYVQQTATAAKNTGSPFSSTAVTVSNVPAVGNTIIVTMGVGVNSGSTAGTCSDDQGNSYTTDVETNTFPSAPYRQVIICSAQIGTGQVPSTITINHSSANDTAVEIHEFSGIAASPRVDKTSVNTGSSDTPTSNSTAASSESNVLVIGAVEVNGPSSDTFIVDSNFTGGIFRTGNTNITINTQYWITSGAAGTYAYAPTLGISRAWADAVATYKATLTCTVTNTADSGAGSLRDCITTANSNPGTTISFNIPDADPNYTNGGSGTDYWWKISPTSPLPAIAQASTIIDGSTQATNYGSDSNTRGPEIEINGASAGAADGLAIDNVGSVTIKELVINGFSQDGMDISGAGATSNILHGNYIGTNTFGEASSSNTLYGVYLSAGSSTNIGGSNAGEGNLISGNTAGGIYITDSNSNIVRGNTIGLDRLKTGKIANGNYGINIDGTSDSNQIGGTGANDGNTISGNSDSGILINQVTNVDMIGNAIGSGSGLGNSNAGIIVFGDNASANINIGSVNSGEGNQINYNGQDGIVLAGVVPGNDHDVEVLGNDISNNGGRGLYVHLSSFLLAKNLIRDNGTTTSHYGIHLSSNITSGKIYQNTLHNNAGHGIFVEGTASAIKNNIITGSGGYGINATGSVTAESNNLITDASTSPANSSGQANGITPDATDLNIDPQYTGSYGLTECSSMAINNGVDLGGDQPDMNGASAGNYNSTAPDMGAYETTCAGSGSDLVIDNDFSDWCDGEGVEYCIDDEGGLNDWEIPNEQYDVTRFGVSTNRYDTFYLMFGFDEVSFGGGEKVTGCVLMDTTQPANDNIDLTLCVDISADPAAIDAVTLYSCDDSIIGGCGNASVSQTYGASDYGFSNSTNGPWDVDSFVEVKLPFAHLGIAGGEVVLTTLVTYPGNNFLKSPKDSIYETGGSQDYGQRVQVNVDTGTTSIIPGPGLQSVSGTVYTDEGSTTIASGKTVRLVVNGVDAGSDTTDASGGYYISVPIIDNDKILVYIDGDGTYKGTTATVFSEPNVISLDIYADHLIVRHDNAGSLTFSNMSTAKGVFSDTDILYDLSGGNLTVSGSATELYIPNGHTFVPGTDIDGIHLEIIGTFTGGTNSYNLSGDFTNGGTFTADSSSVILDGTSQSISGSSTFYDLSKTVASADTLTFEAGSTQTISNSLTLYGSPGKLLSLRSSSSPSQWDLVINSAATKNIDYVDVKDSDASGSDASHKAINPANSVNSGNNIDWFGNIFTWVGLGADDDFNTAANWNPAITPTANDICTINSTSSRQPSVLTNAVCGSLTLGNAVSVMTLTFTGNKNLNITGDVTIGANGFIAPSATPTGVFTIGGSWSDDIGTTNFTGGANLHLIYDFTGTTKTITTDESFYIVGINGDISLSSDITIDNSLAIANTKALTQGANTITHNGTGFTVSGTYSHSCSSTLFVNGNFSLTNNKHYPNIIINSGSSITVGNPVYIDCDVTINSGGTLEIQAGLYLDGDWINNDGTIITTPGSVNMTGVGKQIRGTAMTTFNTLSIGDGAGDSISSANDIIIDGIFTVAAGTTFTIASGKNITTSEKVNINGTVNVSGTTTWSHTTTNNKEILIASGGLLNVQGTDDANRVTMTRIGVSNYWALVANGGLNMQYVDLSYTGTSTTIGGVALNTPNGQTLSLDDVSISNVEDVNNAVMMVYNSPQTINAGGITFDSPTYSTADGDVNVEAKQGTINFINYGGNYGGEDKDNDNGGLANWLNGVGGTVYSDEGTTNVGAGKIVRLVINGVSIGTDTTDALGGYFIIATPTAGDALLVYIDGDDGATTDGTTVTVSDGINLSGLHIYTDHLITRHDNAGSLTFANMSTAKGGYSDTEILYTPSGSLTVTGTNTELYVATGHIFVPGSNVDTVSLKNMGTLTAGANSYNVSGDWSNSGTFTADTSDLVLDGTDQAINGSSTFYDLTKSVASAYTLTFEAGSTQTVSNSITLTGAAANLLSLRSSGTPTKWNLSINAGATKNIDYVDVQDSDASGSDASHIPIKPTNSIDSGNTIDWFPHTIVKKAYLADGTPLTSGITIPKGTMIKFMLYINNTGSAKADVSVQDVLDTGAFAYQTTSIKVDNTVDSCALAACTVGEEAALFSAVDDNAAGSDGADGDSVSHTAGTIDAGNQNAANGQLDISANKLWVILFSVKIQ